MTEKNKMKQLSKRLMVTAGATTLAATGAVLGATVVGNGMTASANSVDDLGQSKTTSQWTANSVDQVKAAIQSQGAVSIQSYQAQWGDTLNAISAAFGMTADDAAQELGLQDHGLLVAGQHMDKQATVIQGLKDAGYLKDGQKQADLGNGDQNMIMVQQNADSNAQNQAPQVQNEGEVNSQVSSQNDQAAADARAAEAAKASYDQHVSDSQAAAEAAQMNRSGNNETPSADASQATAANTSNDVNKAPEAPAANNTADKGDADGANSQAQKLDFKMADDNNQANVTPTNYTPSQAAQPASAPQPAPAAQPSQANVTPAHQNRVDTEALINWFENNRGKLTYSMSGSRNGSDGTADCSGGMVQAMYEAGASKPAWLYNTDSMHSYLQQNGYHLISSSHEWQAERGDIVIWGARGASGGAAGHVQVMTDDVNAISVNYSTKGQAGTAVTSWNFDTAYEINAGLNGGNLPFYVYRQ